MLGTLDIEALRNASRRRREEVIDGLRDRDDPVLKMRDHAVERADRVHRPQVVTASASPWLALATPEGAVAWYRRQNVDGDPVIDVLVEVVAAVHGDVVLDEEYGPPELPA